MVFLRFYFLCKNYKCFLYWRQRWWFLLIFTSSLIFGMLTRTVLRSFSTEALKVVDNVAKQQFAVTFHGAEAIISYEKSGKNITFLETLVPEQFQGKGVGKFLAQYAFSYATENKLEVLCKCHFLAKYHKDNINNFKNLKVKYQLDEE